MQVVYAIAKSFWQFLKSVNSINSKTMSLVMVYQYLYATMHVRRPFHMNGLCNSNVEIQYYTSANICSYVVYSIHSPLGMFL